MLDALKNGPEIAELSPFSSFSASKKYVIPQPLEAFRTVVFALANEKTMPLQNSIANTNVEKLLTDVIQLN